jgi:hypothetical protein
MSLSSSVPAPGGDPFVPWHDRLLREVRSIARGKRGWIKLRGPNPISSNRGTSLRLLTDAGR